jgi:adenine-specific DNA-methyltransferase
MSELDKPYYDSQLITYIGNKRRLLHFLNSGFRAIQDKLGKEKLVCLDGFAGSGAVSRVLKTISSELHTNDLEDYSYTCNSAFLINKSEVNKKKLIKYIDFLNENKRYSDEIGFIRENYAPKDDNNVQPGERVFYTNDNARIIDNVRELLEDFPEPYRTLCLAALIVKASIHNNTSGVFKGFHKKDGIGHFGGKGENALTRIKGEIILDLPLLSDFECQVNVHQKDANELIKNSSLPEFDLVYYDPPYNQHPYGSNYFMLNIINGGKPIDIQDGISGISKDWNKSDYNRARVAEQSMDELIKNTKAKYILISYNNEGIISVDNFRAILSKYGNTNLHEQEYNAYRGSRNLNDRDIKVNEWLWILEKK